VGFALQSLRQLELALISIHVIQYISIRKVSVMLFYVSAAY
jgi:hypothetical protein